MKKWITRPMFQRRFFLRESNFLYEKNPIFKKTFFVSAVT